MDLKQYIIDASKKLNIDIIGFTDCEPFCHLKYYLLERQSKNIQTEFEEKDILQRIEPRLTLQDCKTIIVIGLSYNNTFDKRVDYRWKGILSKSTFGLDYHRVLNERIIRLIEEMENIANFKYKHFVDTGPLIDRELARKAGIGYYGKNCSIINDDYGSFIFLGYILTDLEIEIKPNTIEGKCGECNLCIKHCPTRALEEPYKFNPMKCISYLTQTKEKIPYELREKMGVKIYGCDTCQLVCPKNKDIKKPNYQEFLPKLTGRYVDIEKLISISKSEFKENYGSMSGAWRGRNILRRNGIIALGNIKDRNSLRLLEKLLEEPSPMIRQYAAWAILNIDFEYGREVIAKAIEKEKDKYVKLEMEDLLKFFHNIVYQ